MTELEKAARQALEAFESDSPGWRTQAQEESLTALRQALEQAEKQEPAGWRPATFHRENVTFNPGLPDEQTVKFWKLQGVEIEYCYTTPQPQQQPVNLVAYNCKCGRTMKFESVNGVVAPQREWVGLTTAEFDEIHESHDTLHDAMWATLTKLKEKNT